MPLEFRVHLDVEDMEGKNVLVFLRPLPPSSLYRIHAWQVLTGSQGSTETFEYDPTISVDVSTPGVGDNTEIVSNRVYPQAGQLFRAMRPDGLSPHLVQAPTSDAEMRLTPTQVGVRNETNPFAQITVHWYVSDHRLVSCPRVDRNMTCSFEHFPRFFFRVQSPPLRNETFSVQVFSALTSYTPPRAASAVDVHVSRTNGLWGFDFNAVE